MRRKSDVEYVVADNGCWVWALSINSAGYGLKWDAGEKRLYLAHRWYYQQAYGPVADGLQIDHTCNLRTCVNPLHLEAVTPRVNNERRLERAGFRPHPAREAPEIRSVDTAECIVWTGCRDRDGYGAKWVDGRRVMVHRWAYEQANGRIPTGMQIDHLCRNKACYRVDHLEPVTGPENNRRAKWRQQCRQGHEFTPENTVWQKDGKRKCRTCRAESHARSEQRRRERRRRDREQEQARATASRQGIVARERSPSVAAELNPYGRADPLRWYARRCRQGRYVPDRNGT